ncbi:very short patch repair endonuclease [Nocardia sp. NPDC058497]|uniref:very short patch repair endonuclease n=1 Tax=Nocardia sp. NPDC058497 TaxID=3346529 RepID=UPI00364B79AC
MNARWVPDGGGSPPVSKPVTDAATSARMSRQKRADTNPELALRRELHRAGLRYFVDRAPIKGLRRRADVVFPRLHIAVYVDGCFWHRCPEHATDPKNNAQWWAEKLAGNVARDRATDAALIEAGWQVVRVWEHEDPQAAAEHIRALVRELAPGRKQDPTS